MITSAICVKAICNTAVICYLLISGVIALFLFDDYDDILTNREKACGAIFWPLIIVLLPIIYIIKKIKQSIKLKEANKLEENKRKKETVYTVLRELKLR